MYEFLAEPCRNFCILSGISLIDPVDSKEKLVLCSFVSQGTGMLIFVDTEKGNGEEIKLPGDEGAWALLNLNNEMLLVGTCGLFGYLHCLDLRTRKWKEPLRTGDETYIWNLVKASDGMVYGGTYPGCLLVKYDPEKHFIESLGRMSYDAGNMYCRSISEDVGGRLFINCGFEKNHVTIWDINKKEKIMVLDEGSQLEMLTEEYACISYHEKRVFYNPYTFEKIDPPVSSQEKNGQVPDKYHKVLASLRNGSLAGILGQEYFIMKHGESVPELKKIPVEPPATGILSITCDDTGKIWGSSNFGQTIFSFDPESEEYWNSLQVCKSNGEVYGIKCFYGIIFMSSYAGGDHIVYDPLQPWNRIDNINPKVLKPAGPKLIRPFGKSVIGPDGGFWTGWMADYGILGGGISRVDTRTLEVEIWYDPVPEQSISGIASGDKYIYFITGGNANGLQPSLKACHLCMWDTGGNEVKRIQFSPGVNPQSIEVSGGRIAISCGRDIMLYDSLTLNLVNTIHTDNYCSCMTRLNDRFIIIFFDHECAMLDVYEASTAKIGSLPGYVSSAVVGRNNVVFFASGKSLYSISLGSDNLL